MTVLKSYPIDVDKQLLWSIYNRCTQRIEYYNERVARTTNIFVSDDRDVLRINDLLESIGITQDLIENQFDYGFDVTGYNFNVISPGGFVKPHKDTNSTKLNILLNDSTDCPIHFESGEKYYYEHPVLLDVSQTHSVDNCESITEDRVTFQVFFKLPFKECERILDARTSN